MDKKEDTEGRTEEEFFEMMKSRLDKRLGYAEKFKEKIKAREEDKEKE